MGEPESSETAGVVGRRVSAVVTDVRDGTIGNVLRNTDGGRVVAFEMNLNTSRLVEIEDPSRRMFVATTRVRDGTVGSALQSNPCGSIVVEALFAE
jgi:hypothetical protein